MRRIINSRIFTYLAGAYAFYVFAQLCGVWWHNYKLHSQIKHIQSQIDKSNKESDALRRKIEVYQTPQYQVQRAKKLGLIK